ncbi:MAG: ABC transporter ATP-binding protein [Lachnospiraceae bacterium]|nr:ABC transporter ATP-binding protein [Lachnospiraceae bacterium]
MSVILKLDQVAYSYYSDTGEVSVMDNMDFTIEKGSFTAIVGPSGCGKSTILSLIAGLLSPTAGFITLYSDDFAAPKIGYMLQHDHLLEWRDIYHNVILGLEIQHKLTPQYLTFANELLEKYNLAHTKNLLPSELSGGMRQRIALIRTLTLKPDLLLLDEPFSALDYQTRLLVSKDVHHIIKSENKTALLVTHDISEAIAMADNILLLSKSPCHVKQCIPIEFEKHGITRDKVRDSKLFQDYFDLIWRELQNENTET